MPLKVIVVGAGIGGLCAALSLRQAGHHVEVIHAEGSSLLTSTESNGLDLHHSSLLIAREIMMLSVVRLATMRVGILLTVNLVPSRFSRSQASQPRSALQ